MVPNRGDVAVQKRADEGARTLDLVLTMDALYQLSYVGARANRSRSGACLELSASPSADACAVQVDAS
jgi:hypothetical protein